MTEEKPQTGYLAPDVVLKLILNDKDRFLDTLIKINGQMKKTPEFAKNIPRMVTSSISFWEAFSSLSVDEIQMNAQEIHDLLANLPIIDYQQVGQPHQVQTEERILHLRKIAFGVKQ